MPKVQKHTMTELLDAIEVVGKDPKHAKYHPHFIEMAMLIANHVRLMNEIKKFKEHMVVQKQAKGEMPMVQDILKGEPLKPKP